MPPSVQRHDRYLYHHYILYSLPTHSGTFGLSKLP